MRPFTRRGLTLVEVLVALTIVAVIAGILIPAIQQAREAARRNQCKNNLKQFGLALHNYQSTHSMFPSGFVAGDSGVYQGWGWSIQIRPYLNASPYYNRVNFSSGLQTDYALPHMNSNEYASIERCPSDVGSQRVEHASVVVNDIQNGVVTTATADAIRTFPRTNYFGVAGYLQEAAGGIAHHSSGNPPPLEPHVNAGSLGNFGTSPQPGMQYCDSKSFGGTFGQNSSVSLKCMKDGTSNTIMVGERATPTSTFMNAIGHGTWLGVPNPATAAGLAMTLGDTSIKINSAPKRPPQTTGFGSRHRGGAHFLLGDGSVRFITENVDTSTYRDISTISDGRIQNYDDC